MAAKQYYYGLGRRKAATARARLYPKGSGSITINDKPAADYFSSDEHLLWELRRPLVMLEREETYDITVKVDGGGLSGQVDAVRLAISKALSEMDDDLRSTLKKAGFLKRDAREKERKKYGLKRARKAEQYTKR